VGELGGLAHRHVDHHQRIKRSQRLAEPLRVSDGVSGICRLDEHGAISPGMISKDLICDQVAGHQPAHHSRANHWAGALGLAVGEIYQSRGDVVRARLPEAPGEENEQPVQITHQG